MVKWKNENDFGLLSYMFLEAGVEVLHVLKQEHLSALESCRKRLTR